MNLSVTKIFEFEAAHFLPDYPGNCGQLHGHSYKLEVEYGVYGQKRSSLSGEFLLPPMSQPDETYVDGIVIDFSTIKRIIKRDIIEILDHQNLNEVDRDGFPYWMPTTENMALWIWQQLEFSLKPTGLQRVRLWETSTSYAEVRR